ncbi:MAG TPA: ABC transporter permease [Methanoregulaceae archaeon]|nr:ABC transporter permease [Methanoregulaceae archaeon]
MTDGWVSWRVLHVWERNFHVFVRTWKVSFLPPLFDSLFFLVALGYGLGQFVPAIDGVEYARFVAPAVVAIGIMNASYYETTYGSFVRMYYQKTFDALIATPVTIEEVIVGEILWGATKSVIYTALILPLLAVLGVISLPGSLLLLVLALPGGLLFGGIGLCFTARTPSIDTLSYPQFLFITPMMVISGTFFPIESLPVQIQWVAFALMPLAHLVSLSRALTLAVPAPMGLVNLLWLTVVTAGVMVVAVRQMRRRLVV